MDSFFDPLMDLLFPPCCPCCRRILDQRRALACAHCYPNLPWLPEDDALTHGNQDFKCVSAGLYEGNLREILHAYKFEGQRQLASGLALPLAKQVKLHYSDAFDLITWIPVSPQTLKARGYDQARLLAEALAVELDKAAVPLLQKLRHTPAQSSLSSPSARRTNVMGVFTPVDPFAIAGLRILVTDDIITTGATLEEATDVLLRAGATQVLCAAFCHTPPAAKPR